ncbi:MAG: DNA polymerase III subunit gamma/tau [Lachnospiraceae bacterium]|nr:DNA polymerase III subunit gamma/tau [Lachnospiraceae bacterium]
MSYTALYRKWRPPVFDDVKGQDPIVSALRNQIHTGRIGHAYLFCGTRGTGKTSVAKIFARAVNCEAPVNGNPCNQCSSCRAVNQGNSVNVMEIDAASNNGVDNIREIRDEVRYAPTEGRYKVYIIDEVHMLSTGAFNALLKTLEEPPAHVIFILATTEVHKIPVTVLSRCQRYDFRRISVDVIASRLKQLTDGEGVEIEDRALKYIARKADGSMRDSISLLDQCIAFHYGELLTYDKVLDVLGAASYDLFGSLLEAALDERTADCIGLIDEIVMQGRELGQLVSDFIWYLRNIMLLKASDLDADTLEVSEEELLELGRMSRKISEETLLRYIRVFSELSGRIRYANDKRVLLEMAFIKLIRPETEYNLDSVLNRLEILEKKLAQGYVAPSASLTGQTAGEAADGGIYTELSGASGRTDEERIDSEADPDGQNPGNSVWMRDSAGKPESQEISVSADQMSRYEAIRGSWGKIVSSLVSRSARIALQKSEIEPDRNGSGFCIVFFEEKYYAIGARTPYLTAIREAAQQIAGIDCEFRFELRQDGTPGRFISDEQLQSVFQGIEIEDE